MTLIIGKSSNENEKDFNWFLTNEEELKRSNIEPIGLKNQTVNMQIIPLKILQFEFLFVLGYYSLILIFVFLLKIAP